MSTATAPRSEKLPVEIGDPAALLARTQDLNRRLQEREEFYRSFMESLGEGVLITDRESRILYANSRIECLTGLDDLGAGVYRADSGPRYWS